MKELFNALAKMLFEMLTRSTLKTMIVTLIYDIKNFLSAAFVDEMIAGVLGTISKLGG